MVGILVDSQLLGLRCVQLFVDPLSLLLSASLVAICCQEEDWVLDLPEGRFRYVNIWLGLGVGLGICRSFGACWHVVG